MHRFHLPPAEADGDLLRLTGAEAHHALHVLRLRGGEQVTVLDGAGRELLCKIRALAPREVALEVLERRRSPEPATRLTLLQAVPKGAVMDDIVGKATQLGASRIAPVLTARGEVRLDPAAAARKAAKWRHTAIESLKQCGLPWLPEILPAANFKDALAKHAADLALVASLREGAAHPRDVVGSYHREHGRLPAQAAVWIGPEGDFTPEELHALERAGVKPVTLGPRVLRCDTAAVSCLAVLNAELAWLAALK
ncbi:MAG: 16S rRNA (uracil(1498)-N(3))-methyltransferase [Verrucomicrobia bacterium]|nr:16S rRNA (uracil(1498)-N(3))-methyltransferase [Verrucomicrobiota bacterium]